MLQEPKPWRDCLDGKPWVAAGDSVSAMHRLAQAIGDDVALASWRRMTLEMADGSELSRIDDHQLFELLLQPLAEGFFLNASLAAPLVLQKLVTVGAVAPAAPAAAASPAFAGSPRPAPVAAPEPSVPATTFGADLDIEAMVGALRAAAVAGVPFCEECARAAAKRKQVEAAPA